jgi:hypothetical protein
VDGNVPLVEVFIDAIRESIETTASTLQTTLNYLSDGDPNAGVPQLTSASSLINTTTGPSVTAFGEAMTQVDEGMQIVPVLSSIYNAQKFAFVPGQQSPAKSAAYTGLAAFDLATLGTGSVARKGAQAIGGATLGRGLLTEGVPNAGGAIRSFVTSQDQTFFRVFSGNASRGAFLTAVPPRSRAFAVEALALPPANGANFIQSVFVPAGTRLQRSRVLPQPQWLRRGGAEQFQLLENLPSSSFGRPRVFR